MQIITINLPEKYLGAIQVLNDLGIYPSRSEAIRKAIGDLLTKDLKLAEDLNVDTFKSFVQNNRGGKA